MKFGNLCIAGHNYANNTHFAKLNYLNNGDLIKIYDINGNFLNYIIYDKYEVEYNNLECTGQETNGEKIITLITCKEYGQKRLIVKAKETK